MLDLSTQAINTNHVQRAGFDVENQIVYLDMIGFSITVKAASVDGILILRYYELADKTELARLETKRAGAHYKEQLKEYQRRMDAGDLPEDARPPELPETRFTV